MNKKEIVTSIIVVLVSILAVVAFAFLTKKETINVDDFAKCVTNKGLTMYGAVWCAHCINEKKAFGNSFKFINYVECPDNIQLCSDKGVNGYPTWIDAVGKKYEGEQGLAGLARITGCELPL